MTPLEYLRCVGMESGGEFATDSSIGVQKMLELCADNLGSLIKVKQLGIIIPLVFLCDCILSQGAYIVNGTEARTFRTSVRPSLLGEVHYIGTESKLLDCSHSSIGRYLCGRDTPVPDIIISCFACIHVT